VCASSFHHFSKLHSFESLLLKLNRHLSLLFSVLQIIFLYSVSDSGSRNDKKNTFNKKEIFRI
jgi:hypothetical protein